MRVMINDSPSLKSLRSTHDSTTLDIENRGLGTQNRILDAESTALGAENGALGTQNRALDAKNRALGSEEQGP